MESVGVAIEASSYKNGLLVCVAELSWSQNGYDDELTEATESLSGEAADTAATAAIAALPLSAATVSLVSTAALPLDSSGHAAPMGQN